MIAETTPDGILLRPAATLPAEIYSKERIRESDEAETELAAALGRMARTGFPGQSRVAVLGVSWGSRRSIAHGELKADGLPMRYSREDRLPPMGER
jgi:hypothetical protein